jgi:hypothetical protein
MNRKDILRSLGHARQSDELENVVLGCVQICNQCGQSVQDWLRRKPERLDAMRRPRKTQKCQRVIDDLIDFTASTIVTCAWVDTFWVGCLPVRAAVHRSAKHLEAMQKGRQAASKRLQDMWEARLAI